MKATLVTQESPLVVAGLSVRTCADNAMRDLGHLWQEFFASGCLSALTEARQDDSIYVTYCDYESDYRSAYTAILGFAVRSGVALPKGTTSFAIPAGNFANFTVEGHPVQVIRDAWGYVNETWTERSKRKYVADFERYCEREVSNHKVRAAIMIGMV